jgi:hypothetical protein
LVVSDKNNEEDFCYYSMYMCRNGAGSENGQ